MLLLQDTGTAKAVHAVADIKVVEANPLCALLTLYTELQVEILVELISTELLPYHKHLAVETGWLQLVENASKFLHKEKLSS